MNRTPGARTTPRPLRPAPEPGAVTDPPHADAALRIAAAAVRAAPPAGDGEPLDWKEAEPLLECLVAAAAEAMGGGVPARGGPAACALGVHLLGLLRAEVIRAWRDAEPRTEPEPMLDVLEAMEQVRLAIVPEWSNEFNARLTGPDGLDLVVGVAHDLRSPLTSVLFLADTLSRGRSGPVNDLQRRQLRLIYSAALGLNSLSSDVIELARGGDKLLEKELEPFSLAEVFESLRDMVLPIAEEKGVEIRYALPPNDRRMGRPLALSRVLLNLTTNALKFTDKGYVEIRGVSKGLAGVEFSVRDTGHGISADAIADLYQPFRRSHGRSRRSGYHFSGTGLGLAMCRKLLEAMGSELKYETRPEWGTRFFFEVELPTERRL